MDKFHRETLKQRVLKLAELRSTGRPVELASRLDISERSVKRLVKELRDSGRLIRFNKTRGSYVAEKKYR